MTPTADAASLPPVGVADRPVRSAIPGIGDPRWAFGALLTLYAIFGCAVLGFNRSFLQVALTVAACCVLDMVLGRWLHGRWFLPLSAYISGMSLSLILSYAHSPWLLFVPVYFTVASKYVFTRRGRHFFNPSLFGIVATLLVAGDWISPAPAYQWGGSWAVSAFLVMAALLLFVFRIGRTPLILSFLGFYILQTALRAYLMRWHLPPETLFLGMLTSAPFFLFTFYMITDPGTSPPRTRDQILVGMAIALVDLVLHKFESLYTFFYAAFLVASSRFLWFHLSDLVRARGRIRIRAAALRPIGALAAIGVAGWGAYAFVLHPYAAPSDPGFRLVRVPEQQSGVTARLGTTLTEVDPRLHHIVKWILSVGDAVASADYDNDGRIDLLFTHPLKIKEDRVILYKNDGDMRFTRVPLPSVATLCAAPAENGLAAGALFADVDNDGDQDIFLNVAFGQCRFLRNLLKEKGAARFVDASDALPAAHSISLAAQFLDADRDGRLDLYVANVLSPYLPDYPQPTPLNIFRLPAPAYAGDRRMFHFMHENWYNAINGGRNQLYRNTGRRFTTAGPSWERPETHWSLAAGTGDLNHDGWTDLYVANDFGPDDLYLNLKGHGWQHRQGHFPGSVGRDTYKGMNASLGDVDGDGNLDIYVSNVHAPLQAEGSLLWMTRRRADGMLQVSDEATGRGVLNEQRFGWGGAMGDLDRNGWLDILQANGMVDDTPDRRFREPQDYWYVNEKVMRSGPEIHAYADKWGDLRGRQIFGKEANRVYINRGADARPQFVDAAPVVGWTERTNSRGIALVDLDNDGDLDAVVTHMYSPPSLYRNDPSALTNTHHWIGLKLEGDGATVSRDAVGTVVNVTYREGGRIVRQMREVQIANGFSAQGDRRLLFGLGAYSGDVDIEIRWYGGKTETLKDVATDRYHTLSLQPATTREVHRVNVRKEADR